MELTPKEKAEKLVYFYQNLLTPLSEKKDDFFFSRCKKCALIAQKNLLNKLKELNIVDEFEEEVLFEINAL